MPAVVSRDFRRNNEDESEEKSMEKRATPWRRWIAMTLAVILTFGSLGSSLAPLVSAEEASGTNTIVNEGFEDFTPNEAADAWTEGSWQDVKQWNGAGKSSWLAQVASGKVKVDANVTGGHSGDYCVKVTPAADGGRVMVKYCPTPDNGVGWPPCFVRWEDGASSFFRR